MTQLLSRRTFLMLTSASIASLAFGCKASEKSNSEWMWAQDDELDVLSMQVAGGAIVAIPGNGWKPQDGWIQVQLSGGSVPGKEIEKIWQEGSTLVVKLKKPSSIAETMDIRLTGFRVSGGNVSSIDSVEIIDKNERTRAELGVDTEPDNQQNSDL